MTECNIEDMLNIDETHINPVSDIKCFDDIIKSVNGYKTVNWPIYRRFNKENLSQPYVAIMLSEEDLDIIAESNYDMFFNSIFILMKCKKASLIVACVYGKSVSSNISVIYNVEIGQISRQTEQESILKRKYEYYL